MTGSDIDVSEQELTHTEHVHIQDGARGQEFCYQRMIFFHIDQKETSGDVTFMLTPSHSHPSLLHNLISWRIAELTWGRVAAGIGWASRVDKAVAPHAQIPFLPIAI